MEFTKRESFIKQIVLYLNSENYASALELSHKFVDRFPDEMVSHFLLAKSAFWKEDYASALQEARTAFNKSRGEDALPCAVLVACAYYKLKKYHEGRDFLQRAKLPETEEVEQLRLIFSMLLENLPDVEKHAEKLLAMNTMSTKKFLAKIILSS